MITAKELIDQLRKMRSDAPVNMVVKDGTGNHYGIVSHVTIAVVDKKSDHARSADDIAIFISNTGEF